ncbi:hypothetical protein AYO20_09674 [Fonsecaea nubica]|uniref:Carbonyl reductase n=1 Tax=Fonsecaea nubica TaxID=856822 RepID=A0A178CGH9_9EURO|nr:hypothetical protein AYO20_09674 [Fonsecaea nubica]OAL27821.1 hypothetical protein AYO20_09674 [Fonsecaea nubica]
MAPDDRRVAIVTGANKGVGLALVRRIALEYAFSELYHRSNQHLTIYLTARSSERGLPALGSVLSDTDLKTKRIFDDDGGLVQIRFHELDINVKSSIQNFAEAVSREHRGIDILVNNAGTLSAETDERAVRETLQCNYYGTLNCIEAFSPLMRPGGRIVNVSSLVSKIARYPANLRQRFYTAQSPQEVNQLMDEFLASVISGQQIADGWGPIPYPVSKAGVTALTKVVAQQHKRLASGVLVNACCPGFVATDINGGVGMRDSWRGAETPLLLALGDIDNTTGKLWANEDIVEWYR